MPEYPANTASGRTTPKGTRPAPERWSSQRIRAWQLAVLRHPEARRARGLATALACRAERYGASVYGSQVNLASLLGCAERSVRYHLAILQSLGLVRVVGCKPERDPRTGRWSRRMSNGYVLQFASSRRLTPTGKPVPVRPRRGIPQATPAALAGPAGVDIPPLAPPECARAALAAARAALQRVAPG